MTNWKDNGIFHLERLSDNHIEENAMNMPTLFKQHYVQQGGRGMECAMPFDFTITALNLETQTVLCPSCRPKEDGQEEIKFFHNIRVEEGALPN
ncbi:TPA: hypothetical protein DEP58_04795 [Patescibacteria group bacterium]|nr:MAG: hypothetical protein UU98_C0019G0009 [Parcubacteria group bacterium GW2011_GWD2_42_14]HCC05583.1 hypothetical protein [Patescibacteria group bacterium]